MDDLQRAFEKEKEKERERTETIGRIRRLLDTLSSELTKLEGVKRRKSPKKKAANGTVSTTPPLPTEEINR